MADFIRIVDNELRLPGVTGRHIFLHISDAHLCVPADGAPEEENERADARERSWSEEKLDFARKFGELVGDCHRVTTVEALGKLEEFIAAEPHEALICSGDMTDFYHAAGSRALRGFLDRQATPCLYVTGNHEEPEKDPVCVTDVQVLDFDGFRLIGVDDSRRTVSDATLATLEKLLADGVPTVIVQHVPLMTARNRAALGDLDPYFFLADDTEDENGARYVALLSSSPAVRAILCGHVHGYVKTEFAEGKPQICASQGMIGFIDRLTIKGL